MRRLAFALLVSLPPLWLTPARALDSNTPEVCPLEAEFTMPEEPLSSVAAAIKAGGPVPILAIGSATTVGQAEGGSTDLSFPYRMVAALHEALPQIAFPLTVRGGKGLTAAEMAPLIQAEIHRQKFPLVLWQTGTVEAVRGMRPDDLRDALATGVADVTATGSDVILIDPQFSRFLRSNTDLDPYEHVLQEISAMPDVVLFRRFDLMRSWANSGGIDLERTKKADQAAAMTALHACLGKALAQFILNGAGQQTP